MQLNTETSGQDLIIIVAAARIDAVQAIAFKEKFRAAVASSAGRVVLDLSSVNFIDSSGLGALVASMKILGSSRKLELCALQDNVEKVFRLTRLDSVFKVHKTLTSVRAGLTGSGPATLVG
jgi:anti-sigma B factor antagonist